MLSNNSFFKRHTVIFIICILGLMYVAFTLVSQEIKMREIDEKERLCQEQILLLQEEVDIARQDLDKISSAQSIEKLAREKLKMVRPNEIIYIIQEEEEIDDSEIRLELE